jgi:hypothetical protein
MKIQHFNRMKLALRFSFCATLLLMTQGAFGQLTNNQPPVVTWISPANGETFLPGATISLIARVDTNNAFSFIEFLRLPRTKR